jgi:hypothetical protein
VGRAAIHRSHGGWRPDRFLGTPHAFVVGMLKKTTAGALRQLIDVCIDDQRMLDHESRTVEGHRKEVLERLGYERADLIATLEGLDAENDVGAHPGSWQERAREIVREIRTAVGGPSSGDSVMACLRSCRRTEERFDATLELPWPLAIRSVLVEERARLDDARRSLIAIKY